ncbi:MAG: PLP-dependent aminotransferase family protein [Verrucomicrobia bacterium]|nr:PLP-dependent aminotransferase family protein [Verrucomicrobiota bacterium]
MDRFGLSELGRRTAPPPISWLMRLALDRRRLISLAAGFTDRATLPVAEARQLLDGLLHSAKDARPSLQYGPTEGDPRLRRVTAGHVRDLDGRAAGSEAGYSPARVLITHGSQQLLYMVAECLADPGDIILVEDPTYLVFLAIVQSHGLRCRGIPVGPEGLDLEFLDRLLAGLQRSGELGRVKLCYLVSYFQNPTGVTTSFERKAGLLELLRHYERAAGHRIYLLEDSAYRELRFAGPDVPSALAVRGHQDRLIYSGTYSKPFATGVRVGYGFLPEPLFTAVNRVKGNHDFGTSNLLQQLLARALASGCYAAHLEVLRRRYAHKARVMTKALRTHFPAQTQWQEPAGGLYVWARLPKRLRSGAGSVLFQNALTKDVLYVPGALCYAADPRRRKPDHEMRLSFGGATEADIRTGIARLGGVVKQLVR